MNTDIVIDEEILRKRVNNDYYVVKRGVIKSKLKTGHVFDEDKSVKWNREEVEKYNAEIDNEYEKYREAVRTKQEEFEKDVIDFLIEYFDFSKEIAKMVFDKAYEEGHSSGYYQVVNEAIDFGDFADDIIRLVNKK